MDPQDPRSPAVPDGTPSPDPQAPADPSPAEGTTGAPEDQGAVPAPEPMTPTPAEPTADEAPAAEPAEPASVTEPVTPEPVTPEPVTPEPVTPEPVTPEPVTPEPVTPEPVTPEPVTPEPMTPEPLATPAVPATPTPTPEPMAAPAVPAAVVAPPTATPNDVPPAAVDPQPEPDADAEAPHRGRALAVLPLVLLALGALLLAGGAVFLGLQVRDAKATDEAREEALAASRDAARVLFSYNHETLEDDFSKGLAVTTGPFRQEYSNTTQNVVKDVATQYKAVVKAQVNEAGIISASPDEVVALVFLNQVTTSTRVEGEKIDQSRVRMRLVERNGHWLVDRVEAL